MIPLSVLDLSPIPEGSDAGQALRNSRDLARHAEALGYRRYWMAEHHNMPGIASAATAVVLAHVAAGTQRIRIGAGGIMLPNHAPLVIAEQFGTLAALYPGRIDLGLGRAPGTDQVAARALRRNLAGDADDFPRDVVELMGYFRPAEPGQALRAVPGAGQDVDVWILGSSTFGAQLAAMLGLPYAFASHFAPAQMMEAIGGLPRALPARRERLATPHVMLGRQRLRGRHRRRGAVPVHLAAAGLREPAARPAGQAAAAGRGLRGAARPPCARHAATTRCPARWSARRRRCGAASPSSPRAPARTS